MAMNYDNDMNQTTRRRLPRMNPSAGAGYARRMPMPLGPSSMGSGSDVLRNFANRRGKLGPVVERPMLPTSSMAKLPSLDPMPSAAGMVRGPIGAGVPGAGVAGLLGRAAGDMVAPVGAGVRGVRRRVGAMMPQDMDREALMQALSRVAGGAF